MKYRKFLLKISFFLLIVTTTSCIDFLKDEQSTLRIIPDSVVLQKGFLISLGISLNGNYYENSSLVEWTSEDTNVVCVSSFGTLSPVSEGETNVVAIFNKGESIAKCKVTVSESSNYKFRILLKDKGMSDFDLNKPETFLSEKAIERRRNHNIQIDESDLPISNAYINEIKRIGGTIVAKSKWLNSVTVYCEHENMVDLYRKLPFVERVELVWKQSKPIEYGPDSKFLAVNINSTKSNNIQYDSTYYGYAWNNIKVNNGYFLHDKGYKGNGIIIAIIDEAFRGLLTNPSLSNILINGSKSFIFEDTDPYNFDSHGVWVLSCMAGNSPGFYVGTAPEASYWLLRTEDTKSEQAVEEDYWVDAIEYADSAGVDVVNTSLLYRFLDWDNYNGKTAFSSCAANMASQKGILIVCCAGNESTFVGSPGDAPNILTVGAVNVSKTISDFSCFGMTVDGRMKPDILALGSNAAVLDISGTISIRNGTSYSSPIICGLAACLWQAFPNLSNSEIMRIIIQSSDRSDNPILPYGNGIPNMEKAYQLALENYQ